MSNQIEMEMNQSLRIEYSTSEKLRKNFNSTLHAGSIVTFISFVDHIFIV